MSSEEKNVPQPALNRFDLLKVYLRAYFLEAVWNYEKYLNYGFAFALLPALRKLYTPEERAQALTRHLEYFNTQPYMASFVLGAVTRMEEEKQQLPPAKRRQKEEEISALKVGMMGPVAAMGDSLFWATWRPYCGLLAVALVLSGVLRTKGVWFVPSLFFAVYNAVHLGIRTMGFFQGYRRGDQVVLTLRRLGFQKIIRGVRMASILLLALLIVFVNVAQMETEPSLFALKLTFFAAIAGLFTFTLKKKINPSQLFYSVVLFALMLAYWPEISVPPDAVGKAGEGVAGLFNFGK